MDGPWSWFITCCAWSCQGSIPSTSSGDKFISVLLLLLERQTDLSNLATFQPAVVKFEEEEDLKTQINVKPERCPYYQLQPSTPSVRLMAAFEHRTAGISSNRSRPISHRKVCNPSPLIGYGKMAKTENENMPAVLRLYVTSAPDTSLEELVERRQNVIEVCGTNVGALNYQLK
ncbi:hypothetical protein TURU_038625 [Turdus rufiventris]|nr:hypothetical protein TURU_038625 [Turdus rufiventris]